MGTASLAVNVFIPRLETMNVPNAPTNLKGSHNGEPLIMRGHSALKPEEAVGRVSENL